MKNCPNCGAPMSDSGTFCPACGKSIYESGSGYGAAGGNGMDTGMNGGQNTASDPFQPEEFRTDSYQQNGYQQNGYQQSGYPQNGYPQNGYQQSGYQQNGYQQSGYQQNGYQQNSYVQQEKDRPMTTGDWLVTMLLMMIPVANFVLLLVWAFSSDTNTNKKNWARAELILMLIAVGITVLFTVAVVGSLASVFASL